MLGLQQSRKKSEDLSAKINMKVEGTITDKKYEKFLNDTLVNLRVWSADSLRMVDHGFQAVKRLGILKKENEVLFPVASSITAQDVKNFSEKRLSAINEVQKAIEML